MANSEIGRMQISVVIPVYNEAESLQATIRKAIPALRASGRSFEVILIDDGSRDKTPAVAERLADGYAELRFVRNPVNLGQGPTLARGFALARGELITHNAIDYPFDLRDLPPLLSYFPEAGVVVATRRSYPGATRTRRFVSGTHRMLIRILFGLRITDYNFVQIYRRDALERIQCFSEATAFMTVERIVRIHDAGELVVAVEADYHPRTTGRSSSGTVAVVMRSLIDMIRLWMELRLPSPARRNEKIRAR